MRTLIIVGNWKMNKTVKESIELTKDIITNIPINLKIEIVICPPYTSLYPIYELIKNTPVKLGAQNSYIIEKGAYTGEISPLILKEIGCNFVIIGHSERRKFFNETNDLINQKIKAVLKYSLIPIICIGEKLEERETGKTFEIIKNQLLNGIYGLSSDEISKVIIAYEPIWAIGTGKNATPFQAEEIHLFIRNLLKEKYDKEISTQVRIQYGGSVTPENIKTLMNKPDIDGALIGGASLNAKSFIEIIQKIREEQC